MCDIIDYLNYRLKPAEVIYMGLIVKCTVYTASNHPTCKDLLSVQQHRLSLGLYTCIMTKKLISGKTLRGPTGRHFCINANVRSPTRAVTHTSQVTATSHIRQGPPVCREAIALTVPPLTVLRLKAFRAFGTFQRGRVGPQGKEGDIRLRRTD